MTGTAPTGGNTPYTYQWQSSTNNITFTDIVGATGLTYQPGALTQVMYYKLRQTSNSGAGTVYTNTVTISINPLPTPTLTGPATVCATTAGNVYTTQTGMTNYVWTISAGGTITGGGTSTSSSVTVTWNTAGAQWVSVNYANANGCTAVSPTQYNVTVNALPTPTLTGPASICVSTTGNVYTTQSGMTNYVWTISAGGTITAGGTSTSSTITVTWNTTGAQWVRVNYTNANGCTAVSPTQYNVTVHPLPLPSVNIWNNYPCVGSDGNQFYTESGMINYVWTVTGGGQITAGQGTDNIMVTWVLPGLQTISVTYTNANGCTADPPGTYLTMVDPYPDPAGNITGSSSVCAGENGVAYSINPVANATSYTWTLPSGASIATGAGTNAITVNFSVSTTSGNITVAGTNDCGDGTSSSPFAVTVNPLPAEAGAITGDESVCQGDIGVSYSVATIASATGYVWTIPAGATIASGTNTNHITVNFSASASSGVITVYGTNACGNGASSPEFNVTVNPIPPTPIITQNGTILTSNAPAGNQWYFNGTIIPGATSQTYEATQSGDYYVIVTLNGCSSDPSNIINVIMVGIRPQSGTSFTVYPVPNDGQFTVTCNGITDENLTLEVYNYLGVRIYNTRVQPLQGSFEQIIDLRPVPNGVYTVVLRTVDNRVVRRILVNK